jgi:hypothetical protein
MRSIGAPEMLVIIVVYLAIAVLICGRIFAQAGYSKWLGLTTVIPLVNLIVLVWFAFAKWPIRLELDRLRVNQPTHL